MFVPVPAGRHFSNFFRPDSGPPPGTYAFTAKKGKFICTGHVFPHGMAFLEKRGGLVPVNVFIFPGVLVLCCRAVLGSSSPMRPSERQG